MGIELLAHIGIPFVAGIILLLVVAATEKEPIAWSNCNDIALDLTILSIGANGGIFVNPTLIKHWGDRTPVYGILVVLLDLLFAGVLVYIRRFRTPPVRYYQGLRDVFLGCLTVAITAGVLYLGL